MRRGTKCGVILSFSIRLRNRACDGFNRHFDALGDGGFSGLPFLNSAARAADSLRGVILRKIVALAPEF